MGLANHVAIEIDDLTGSACAPRRARGCAHRRPMPRGDGYDQIFLRDPDGHVIELFQFTGEDQSDAPLREPIRG
jgi:catechol 2,3-dioxygenase-like lactoylglutathione lyase family enzyme